MAKRKKTKPAPPRKTQRKPKRRKVKRSPRAVKPPPRTIPVTEAMSEGFGEITSLAEEMRDWHSNIEDKFPTKAEAVDEAAGMLENATEPSDNYDALKVITVTIQDPAPTRRYMRRGRAHRLEDALGTLQLCMDALEDAKGNEALEQGVRDAAETLHDEIDSAMQEVDGVDFPGMYG